MTCNNCVLVPECMWEHTDGCCTKWAPNVHALSGKDLEIDDMDLEDLLKHLKRKWNQFTPEKQDQIIKLFIPYTMIDEDGNIPFSWHSHIRSLFENS